MGVSKEFHPLRQIAQCRTQSREHRQIRLDPKRSLRAKSVAAPPIPVDAAPGGKIPPRLIHPERPQNLFRDILQRTHARHVRNHAAHEHVPQIRVLIIFARVVAELRLLEEPGVEKRIGLAQLPISPRIIRRRQSAAHAQQLPHRHPPPRSGQPQLRHILRHAFLKPQLPLIPQPQHRRRGKTLRHRSNAKRRAARIGQLGEPNSAR
jgi:hypothetical protein